MSRHVGSLMLPKKEEGGTVKRLLLLVSGCLILGLPAASLLPSHSQVQGEAPLVLL